jgi:endonuclease YncB( thermonuclease family)
LNIRAFISKYNITIVTAILLSASIFYFIGAQKILTLVHSSNPEAFSTGDIVRIVGVIDGDEILIENDAEATTRVRIIGIMSFDPTVSDPLLSGYGNICFHYLKSTTIGQRAKVVVADKVLDGEGRLLATLFMKDSRDDYSVNLGLDLVRKGYTLVYTKYDFPDIEQYLTIQKQARENSAGFWSNEALSDRADSLSKLWKEERVND